MPLLVVCATRTEMEAALAFAGPPDLPAQGETRRADLAGRDCLLLVTGVGPLSAALHAGLTLGRTACSGLLCLGVAGSFDTLALPLCATATVGEEIFADYGLAREHGVDPRGIRFPQGGARGLDVFDRLPLDPDGAARALGLALPGDWPRASCLTVVAASGDAAVARSRAAHGCGLEAMEGFALAYAAAVAGLPLLMVRTVSNRVGARPPAHWELPGALAALGAAARTLFHGG